MSRSGYSYDPDTWAIIRWRGAVTAAIRGKRGQSFLREMLSALDSLQDKRLIAHELERDGDVCALGSLGRSRQIDLSEIDPEDYHAVAEAFGIPEALAREIEDVNDDDWHLSAEERFVSVRRWVVKQLREE